jgi:hypothetical protein
VPISDVVTVNVTTQPAPVTRAGFDVPLIYGSHTHYSDRVRFYSALSEMETDGFISSEPEYMAAAAVFAQNPAPARVAVGRGDYRPLRHFILTPVVGNSTAYKVPVNGQEATFTSDATATAAEIVAGLKAAIDALAIAGLTTATTATTLTATASVAGGWLDIGNSDPTRMSIVQDQASDDALMKADLSAFAQTSSDWYAIVSIFGSRTELLSIADWANSNGKIFIGQTKDTEVGDPAVTTDVGSAGIYDRAALMYRQEANQFAGAAWEGRCLPIDAGSETWFGKTLNGITPTSLSSTQLSALKTKHVNWYYSLGGRGVTAPGVMMSGVFIDRIRGRDWLTSEISADLLELVTSAPAKIPFTPEGILSVEAAVRAVVDRAIRRGFLTRDPAPVFTFPTISQVSSADKAARTLRGVSVQAWEAGAIHSIQINVNLSV